MLPAETQSNLLNVGMRVRKSVPEGYKTGTYSAFSLFDETDYHPTHGSDTKLPKHTSPARAPSGQRELLPFCGINKIGGLSFPSPEEQHHQPSFTFTAVPPVDEVPSLSSSQDSLASTTSSSSSHPAPLSVNTTASLLNRKRLHAGDGYGNNDDDDGETPSVSACLQVPSGEWMDGQVSPRSLVPPGSAWENTRVMAVPRKIRPSLGLVAVPSVVVAGGGAGGGAARMDLDAGKGNHMALGQENMVVDEDFPEADFLDYEVLVEDEMEI